MNLPKNALNWFEIPVTDFGRAQKFYSAIFAYEMPEYPMPPNRMGILPYAHEGGGIGVFKDTEGNVVGLHSKK